MPGGLPPADPPGGSPVPAPGDGARPEVSGRTAANLLLAAGSLLVGIAAVTFAAVSWGSLGTGGRAAILLALTGAALAAPWPLRRRGLGGSAESVAAIGLALTMLDAFLSYQLLLAGTTVSAPAAGAAIAAALLAAGWAAYGTVAPVRGPRPAAIGLAQFPLLFAALAIGPSLPSVTLAMVGTAGGDLIITRLAGRRRALGEHRAAVVTAIVSGCLGALLALAAAVEVPDPHESLRLSGVLLLAAAVALAGAREVRLARQATLARPASPRDTAPQALQASAALTAASGGLLTAGLALPAAAVLPGRWAAGTFAVIAAAVTAAAWQAARWRGRQPGAGRHQAGQEPGARQPAAGPERGTGHRPAGREPGTGHPAAGREPGTGHGTSRPAAAAPAAVGAAGREPGAAERTGRATAAELAAGSAAVLGCAGVAVASAAVVALLAPLSWVTRPWSGGPASAREAIAPAAAAWNGSPATPLVLGLVSLALWCLPVPDRSRCRSAAVAVAALAGVSLPLAANVPYDAALAATAGVAAALLAAAAMLADRILATAAAIAGLAVAVTVAAWSLTAPAATIAGFAALFACCAAAAAAARTRLAASAPAAGAVLLAGGLAGAAPLAAGWPAGHAGLAVLGAAAAAQAAAAALSGRMPGGGPGSRTPGRGRVSGIAVEVCGWLVAAAGLALASGQPVFSQLRTASAGLLAAGVICLAVAARPDRRPLFWAGLALLTGALWTWLASVSVQAPEPYAAPAAAVVLAFGRYRSRRGRPASSWMTYGPGLGVLLVPSLLATWQDPGQGWLRPLLLGLVSAGIAVAGARGRLGAPLLIGGGAAVLDAGRQLAGPAVRLAGVVPGWVPFAVIGAVLLGTGATYEARLRDLRQIRAALSRLR